MISFVAFNLIAVLTIIAIFFPLCAKANMMPGSPGSSPSQPTISSQSPINNATYNSKSVLFDFSVSFPTVAKPYYSTPSHMSTEYSLDGKMLGRFEGPNAISITLGGLSEGVHEVQIYSVLDAEVYGTSSEKSIMKFTVNTQPPTITSPTYPHTTIEIASMPISFYSSERLGSVEYKIDNGAKTLLSEMTQTSTGTLFSVNGNVNLQGLYDGKHEVVLFVTDMAGSVGGSNNLLFSTAQTEGTPNPSITVEPFVSPPTSLSPVSSQTPQPTHAAKAVGPTTYLFAAVIIIIVSGLLTLGFYEKRGKQKTC